jgi:hypothetical protein
MDQLDRQTDPLGGRPPQGIRANLIFVATGRL